MSEKIAAIEKYLRGEDSLKVTDVSVKRWQTALRSIRLLTA